MIKIKNMIKILSLLLCLGFMFNASDTLAKSGIEDVTQSEVYGDCAEAKAQVSKYNGLSGCASEQAALEAVQAEIGGLCSAFQSSKSEYKKCTQGQKTSNDEATLRFNPEQSSAIESRMTKVKNAISKEKEANKKLTQCKQELNNYLSKAKSAVKQCEKDKKKADKAGEKSEKADKKAEEAKQEYLEAQEAYNNCVAQKGEEACAKEYKKMTKAAEKYNKKQDKADEALDNKSLADEAVLNNQSLDAGGATIGAAGEYIEGESAASVGGTGESGKYVDRRIKITCPEIDGKTVTIFDYLACRITGVVYELRIIVYILAGFGMIAFAYGAIIGKISWKQLSNIAIGLFILSMTTSFIEYVTGARSGDASLKYGHFLPNGDHHQFTQSRSDCSTDPSLCPGASGSALDMLKGEAESSSWSWSDLKASIGSVKDAVRTAANAYSTVKNTVDTVSTAVQGISSAIRNGGNIVDIVMDVADNVNTALKSVNNAGNSLAMSASSISNDLADAGSNAAQREYKDALRSEYQALKKKCEQGIKGCSENEKKALAQLEQDLNDNTTGTDKWLNSTGSNILSALDKASDKANDAENKARDIKANQADGKAIGNKIGSSGLGDALGAAMAIGTAIENSSDGKKK